jgi:hypothetical protein
MLPRVGKEDAGFIISMVRGTDQVYEDISRAVKVATDKKIATSMTHWRKFLLASKNTGLSLEAQCKVSLLGQFGSYLYEDSEVKCFTTALGYVSGVKRSFENKYGADAYLTKDAESFAKGQHNRIYWYTTLRAKIGSKYINRDQLAGRYSTAETPPMYKQTQKVCWILSFAFRGFIVRSSFFFFAEVCSTLFGDA